MNITLSFSPIQAWAITEACRIHNANLPKDEAGEPINPLTPEQYAEARFVGDVTGSWVNQLARISIAAGIDRLTAAEFGRIKAARAASPAVDAAVKPIFESKSIELGGNLWIGGVDALAAANLLDSPKEARVAALKAPPQAHETLA
jgi:hypothetical protein